MIILEELTRFVSSLAWPERGADISANVFVMQAQSANVDERRLIQQNRHPLTGMHVFQAPLMEALEWTRESGKFSGWRAARAAGQSQQQLYESVVWPELAALITNPDVEC